MRLQVLRLENFQGIASLTLDFAGKSASLYGTNESGKTTVCNSVTWLLFGQAANDDAVGFTPKTIRADGEAHGLAHSVEASFLTDAGAVIQLKRTFHEVYKRKRGQAEPVLTGHTTEYAVDGVPVSERQYGDRLCALLHSAQTMRLLTVPDYFPRRLDWKARRKILLEVCGEMGDDEILEADPALEPLRALLVKPGQNASARYTVDEFRAVAESRMKTINAELQSIPARLDEAQKAIPDRVAGLTVEAQEEQAAALRDQLSALLVQGQAAGSVEAVAAAKEALLEAQHARKEAQLQYESARRRNAESAREEVVQAERAQAALLYDLERLDCQIEEMTAAVRTMTDEREALTAQYAQVLGRRFDHDGLCPTCGQPLPQAALEQIRADFNKRRSEKLEEINQDGQKRCSKELIAQMEERIARARQRRDEVAREAERADSRLEQARTLLERRNAEAEIPFSETPQDTALLSLCIDAEKELDDIKSACGAPQDVEQRIEDVRRALHTAEENIGALALRDAQLRRIEALNQRKKELAKAFEEGERAVYLCGLFLRRKVERITQRINARFGNVRFRLLEEQINGGLKECCEVLIPSAQGAMVPYQEANNAARLNAGLEIIQALSAHYGISLPVVVDNAESVVDIRRPEGIQLIRLMVSAADPVLRLELDEE